MDRELLDEQIAYYRARASEYDEWFLRLGRYDRGEAHRRAWFAEVAEVEAALRDARPHGRVLELACGTGLWTRRLVELAENVTAVDASPEVLRINQERVPSARVRYLPGGSVFFVDNARSAQIAARDHRLPAGEFFIYGCVRAAGGQAWT